MFDMWYLSTFPCVLAHKHVRQCWITSDTSVVSYLMQLSGSLSQSILHKNLSQCNQPIVGVSASPLSNASAAGLTEETSARRNAALYIFIFKLDTSRTTIIIDCFCVWIYFLM